MTEVELVKPPKQTPKKLEAHIKCGQYFIADNGTFAKNLLLMKSYSCIVDINDPKSTYALSPGREWSNYRPVKKIKIELELE